MLASGYTDVLGPEESFTFDLPHYLLPPTTTYSLPRLPAPSHDYLLPTSSPSLRLKDMRHLALNCFYGV
jgi:hypothetical protein